MNQVEQIDSELQALNGTLTKQEWSYKSPVGMMEEYNQVTYSMNLLGNGAAVLLIVIGLINFINVMLTGVVARKNEFAVMESIGTSKKQIKKILTLEGGIVRTCNYGADYDTWQCVLTSCCRCSSAHGRLCKI